MIVMEYFNNNNRNKGQGLRIVTIVIAAISALASIFAVLISIIAIIVGYCNNQNIIKQNDKFYYLEKTTAENSYMTNAVTMQPRLNLIRSFSTSGLRYEADSLRPQDRYLDFYFSKVQLKGSLVFRNESDFTAHLIGTFITEGYSDALVLREILLGSSKIKMELFPDEDKDIFKQLSILPGDTISRDIDIAVQNFNKDSQTILHILLLYKNDMDAYYDVYYRIIIKVSSAEGPLAWERLSDNKWVSPIKITGNDILNYGEENIIPKVYKPDEKEKVLSTLDSLSKLNTVS